MREVDVNAKVLAEVDWLEPSSYSFKSSEPAADVLDLHAERQAHPRGAERVVDVESRRNIQRDFRLPHGSFHSESRPRTGDGDVERMKVRRSCHSVCPPAGDRTPRESLIAGVVAVEDRRLLDAFVRRA